MKLGNEEMQDMDTYVNLENARGLNLFYHELGYAIAFVNYAPVSHLKKRELSPRTGKVGVGVIEE